MTQELKQKREELKALSAGYQVMVRSGQFSSVNEGLAYYYAELGHKVLKSYRQWQEEGYQVKRGSKALLLWGSPLRNNGKDEAQKNEPEASGDDYKFFPLAYVFSNLQVEPMEK